MRGDPDELINVQELHAIAFSALVGGWPITIASSIRDGAALPGSRASGSTDAAGAIVRSVLPRRVHPAASAGSRLR